MTKDEALDLALDALEHMLEDAKQERLTVEYWNECVDAITAIKQARSAPYVAPQLVQEPVACVIDGDLYFHHEIDWEDLAYLGHGVDLLYTTPPNVATPLAAQRTWVGLTDEQIDLFINGRGDEDDDGYVEPTGDGFGITDADLVKLVRRAEAKLKEKNT